MFIVYVFFVFVYVCGMLLINEEMFVVDILDYLVLVIDKCKE